MRLKLASVLTSYSIYLSYINANCTVACEKVDAFVSMTAGQLSRGGAEHPDHCNLNPILSTNLQSLGLPGGTQYGAQVKGGLSICGTFSEREPKNRRLHFKREIEQRC